MPIPIEELRRLLEEGFPGGRIEVADLAGDHDHYAVRIEHPSFAGLSRVAQHKLVNRVLAGRLGADLHALSLTTIVPHPPEDNEPVV